MNSVEECIVGGAAIPLLYVICGFPFIGKICDINRKHGSVVIVRVGCQVDGRRQFRSTLYPCVQVWRYVHSLYSTLARKLLSVQHSSRLMIAFHRPQFK